MRHPSPEQLASMQANVGDDARPWFIGVNVMCLALGIFAVALRVASRMRLGTKLGLDDYLVGFALIFLGGHIGSCLAAVKYGMGRHAILISDRRKFAISLLTGQIFYTLGMGAVKLSILALYGRIFQRTAGWFSAVLGATALFVLLYTIPQTFVYGLQCVPLDSLWLDYPVPFMRVYCLNFQAALIAFGIINIATDWFLLVLPVPFILGLKLERRTKWTLCWMFFLGAFVCVVSVVRLFYIKEVVSADVSWDNVPLSVISSLEISSGILAACVPTWRPLFRFLRSGITNMITNKPDEESPVRRTNITPLPAHSAHIRHSQWRERGESMDSAERTTAPSLSLKSDYRSTKSLGSSLSSVKTLAANLVIRRNESSMSSHSMEKMLKSSPTLSDIPRTSLDIELDLKSSPRSTSTTTLGDLDSSPPSPPPPQALVRPNNRCPHTAPRSQQKSRTAPPLSYHNRHIQNSSVFDAINAPDVHPPPIPRSESHKRGCSRSRSRSRSRSMSRSRKSSLDDKRPGIMRVVSSDNFGNRVVSVGRGEDLGVIAGGNGGGRVSEDGDPRLIRGLGLWMGGDGIMVTKTVSRLSGCEDPDGQAAGAESEREEIWSDRSSSSGRQVT
ncbi:hypothetical protein BU24DRAFT_462004 [Aaosphaeria arxii CBS 175.79]|uniref:Rhodopsin domain-containing protein n=1 Tax=Aaosphaeria arxii CBS 175.79 TaxID=1450172 RepID=A0A6A5XR54_9PLEO|nr:uncharacterized protein BU24DRAFT_462004 [Aaosphaeria arxii CBS 175.79]KAF2015775.1 hypothetical protein BU24DRAFT_462004 [Aaosphaeria arxii CBS 175.79]